MDENGQEQTELYSSLNVSGETVATRYRTLSKPGIYSVAVVDADLVRTSFGTLVLVEDVDGNGVIDTATDMHQNVTLLDTKNGFAVLTVEDAE